MVDAQRQQCDKKEDATEEVKSEEPVSETAPEPVKKLTLEELFARLNAAGPECHSLLKKNYTQAIHDELKDKVTKFNGRLEDCVRSGEFVDVEF